MKKKQTLQAKETKRALQAKETKRRIYQCAVTLFREKGFDSVTIEEICNEAKISKGLFYNYFESKEALFIEHSEIISDMQNRTCDAFKEGQTFLDRMRVFTDNNIALMDPFLTEATRVAYGYAIKNPGKSFYASKDRLYYRTLIDIIEYGKTRHEVKEDISTNEVAHLITSVTWGSFFSWLIGFESEHSFHDNVLNEMSMTLSTVVTEPMNEARYKFLHSTSINNS